MKFSALYNILLEIDQNANDRFNDWLLESVNLLEKKSLEGMIKNFKKKYPDVRRLKNADIIITLMAVNAKGMDINKFDDKHKKDLLVAKNVLNRAEAEEPKNTEELLNLIKDKGEEIDSQFKRYVDPRLEVTEENPKKFTIKNWEVWMYPEINSRQDRNRLYIQLKGEKTDGTYGYVQYDTPEEVHNKIKEINSENEVLKYMQLHSKDAFKAEASDWQTLIKQVRQEIPKLSPKEFEDFKLDPKNLGFEIGARPESEYTEPENANPEDQTGEQVAELEPSEPTPEEKNTPPDKVLQFPGQEETSLAAGKKIHGKLV
jgi:hypothetical protein